jgi:hypothetical protein
MLLGQAGQWNRERGGAACNEQLSSCRHSITLSAWTVGPAKSSEGQRLYGLDVNDAGILWRVSRHGDTGNAVNIHVWFVAGATEVHDVQPLYDGYGWPFRCIDAPPQPRLFT